MDLTPREAATLLGRSERTVRQWLQSGRLAGRRVGSRWLVPRHALPLTPAQRGELMRRADDLRGAVEAALPSRLGDGSRRSHRSLVDDDLFVALQAARGRATALDLSAEGSAALRTAAHQIGAARYHFAADQKRAALEAARGALGVCLAEVLWGAPAPLPAEHAAFIIEIEDEVLRRLAGRLRWVESLEASRGTP